MTVDMEVVYATLAVALTGVALYLAWLLRKWLIAKIGVEDMALLEKYAANQVKAVAQMWESGQIQTDLRYRWAAEQVKRRFPKLDDNDIKSFVESAYYWLKKAVEVVDAAKIDAPSEKQK